MTIRILILCTGNICRSPLAAHLLASKLNPEAFEIASAGTSALAGDTMPEIASRIGVAMGASDIAEHRAVALTVDAVSSADLILGLERGHRRTAAQLQPLAVRRVFTLVEFAHVVSNIDDAQLTAMVRDSEDNQAAALQMVMRMRGVVPRLTPERRYDIDDPYGRSKQAYERSSMQIGRAVDRIKIFFQKTSDLAVTTGYGE